MGGGFNAAGINFIKLGHIAENITEVPALGCQFFLIHFQAGQGGHMPDLLPADLFTHRCNILLFTVF